MIGLYENQLFFPKGKTALFKNRGSETLRVFFSSLHARFSRDRIPVEWARTADKLFPDDNLLFIYDPHKSWYVRGFLDDDYFLKTVTESTIVLSTAIKTMGAKRVMLAGVSAGGFAALLYGSKMENGTEVHVRAFNPQTHLYPVEAAHFKAHYRHLKKVLWSDHCWRDLPVDLAEDMRTPDNPRRFVLFYSSGSPVDVGHASRLADKVNLDVCSSDKHNLAREVLKDFPDYFKTIMGWDYGEKEND